MPTHPLSGRDFPRILEAIEVLYRTVEYPPAKGWQPPAWLVKRFADQKAVLAELKERPDHGYLIQEASGQLIELLGGRDDWQCAAITASTLNDKATLIDLKETLQRAYSLTAQAERIKTLAYLESVLSKLGGTDDAKTPNGAMVSPVVALLSMFTNGVSDDRIKQAAQLLINDKLTANEKLTKIDTLIPFPATASAEQLGEMLGVTKQAILKTDWWKQNRKGEKDNEIGRRRAGHKNRAEDYEPPGTKDDDE